MPYVDLKERRKRSCKDCDHYDKERPKLCYSGLYTYIKRDGGKRSYATSGCSWYGNTKRDIYIKKIGNDRRHTSSYRSRARQLGYAID